MQREHRLRLRNDFAAAYRDGRFLSARLLVVRVRPNGQPASRWGFVAGKAVGGAVRRNGVKRRLREAARSLSLRPGIDIVVGARRPAADASFSELRDALRSLLERAGALEPVDAAL
jgi:ribonuclease P protein component